MWFNQTSYIYIELYIHVFLDKVIPHTHEQVPNWCKANGLIKSIYVGLAPSNGHETLLSTLW